MKNLTLRWGWLCAILGGVTYLALTVIIETHFPENWSGSPARFMGFSYADISRALWVPPLLFLLGLSSIYGSLSTYIGRAGKIGFIIAAISLALHILGNVIEFWLYGFLLVPFLGEFVTGSAGSQLGYDIASFGDLILIIGLLLFGASCFQASLTLRWRILPLLLGIVYLTVLFFFFADLLIVHGIIYGLLWVMVGYMMRKDEIAPRPAITIDS